MPVFNKTNSKSGVIYNTGAITTLTNAADCAACVDAGFVIDSSGSLYWNGQDGYGDEKTFMKQLATSLGLSTSGVQAGVVQFSAYAKLEIPFSHNVTDFTSRVDAMVSIKSTTRIDLGLDKAWTELFQPGKGRPFGECSKVVILMTDGANNKGYDLAQRNPAKRFHDAGIKVVVIGMTSHVNRSELLTLVEPDSNYHWAEEFATLVTPDFMNSVVNCEKLSGNQ